MPELPDLEIDLEALRARIVQGVLYAANESNDGPTCQTEGRLLADRVLSRLLKQDWPKTLEELEARKLELGGKG